jgi:hypothetical protein
MIEDTRCVVRDGVRYGTVDLIDPATINSPSVVLS